MRKLKFIVNNFILERELHTIIVDINGTVHWLNKSISIDLRQYLVDDNDEIHDDFSLELVVSDTSLFVKSDSNNLAYLSTW